jgi:glycosyltransferase involved in cell wall biosynthesis
VKPKFSIVIPLKNEEENVQDLIDEVKGVMNRLGEPWELICVDDGSTDGTFQKLQQIKSHVKELRIIKMARNYGQSTAFDVGFRLSGGEFVITMDGDRQNDPQDIPKLIEAMDGFDLVCGQRVKRKDPFSKRIISKMANAIRSRLCQDGVADTGCSLKLYRRACLERIKMYNGTHRFLPALFNIEGFKVKEVPVNHRQRTKGQTKYNIFNRSFNTIADMLAVRWMRKRHIRYEVEREY